MAFLEQVKVIFVLYVLFNSAEIDPYFFISPAEDV
jgi:hypothetical protein